MFSIALKSVPPNEKTTFIKSSKWYKFMSCTARYTRKYTKNGHISTKINAWYLYRKWPFCMGKFRAEIAREPKVRAKI